MVFRLSFSQQNGLKHYNLLAGGKWNSGMETKNDGTGMRYIKARLQESYPDRWRVEQQATPEGWRTTITVQMG